MKTRRFLSWLLVLVMIVSMIPASFAAAANKTIAVNYLFEDGSTAANPWAASIEADGTLSQEIPLPEVTGYEYKNVTASSGATVSVEDDVLTLEVAADSGNVTVNVVYKPALVKYTVEYYQQNVDNDNYALAWTDDTQKALTGSTVTINSADGSDGFFLLPHEEAVIAADGTTKIKVYMDRNYYLMTFNLGGGYGVEPVFARYGAAIGDVADPVRPGYTFTGWDETPPATMPAENTSYTAQWEAASTAKVTIVYWGENANDIDDNPDNGNGYTYIDSAIAYATPGTTVGLSDLSTIYYCGEEAHTHDADCGGVLNCGKTQHTVHTAACLTCGQTVCATHTTGCYGNVGDVRTPSYPPANPVDGQIYGYSTKYIYISGTWYRYTGSLSSGQIATPTCHTHVSSCYGDEIHTHTDACYTYTCGLVAHTHTSSCSTNNLTVDGTNVTSTKLWRDGGSTPATVTVMADGSTVINVYYDREEFTITFKDGDTTVYTINDEWGADLSAHWPIVGTNGTTYNSGERWKPSDSSTYSQVLVYIAVMPQESFSLSVNTTNYTAKSMDYYVEALPGGSSETTYNGKQFNKAFPTIKAQYGMFTKAEDFFDLEGFTQWDAVLTNGSKVTADAYGNGDIDISEYGSESIAHYYTRNSYKLVYISGGVELKREDVKYQASMAEYASFAPTTPPAYLEAAGYEFGGWYSNPECTDAYDFANSTMPAKLVTVYAKWIPVTHTVEVYKDNTLATQIGTTQTVDHRTFAAAPADPENGAYTFVGWFYMDNGVEKAFDFDSMPVIKDLKIYAKWSSATLVPYLIQYQLADGTVIAAATSGRSLGGHNKTFDAKGGEDLYADYQVGFFPYTKSHSLTMALEGDDTNGNGILDVNEYIFVYTEQDAVPYTVKYLNKATEEPVGPGQKVVSNNRYAVVTETAANISGFMPDQYQQRLVVTVGGENEIIFYYTEDTQHALVTEYHYLVNGNVTTEYSHSQLTGTIGEDYSADAIEDGKIDGYIFDHAELVVGDNAAVNYRSGTDQTLTAGGLHFKFYYTYNKFDVYYQSTGETKTYDVVEDFNVTDKVNSGHLYGGIYEDITFENPMDEDDLDGNGIAFNPVAGETYYLKEVPEIYLQPKLYYTYDKHNDNKLISVCMVSAIDDLLYRYVGFTLNQMDQPEAVEVGNSVYESLKIWRADANGELVLETTLLPKNFFGNKMADAYLHIVEYEGSIEAGETFSFRPFFVTIDGVKVTGIKDRIVYTGNGYYTGNNEGLHVSDTTGVSIESGFEEITTQATMLRLRSAFSMRSDVVEEDTTPDGGDNGDEDVKQPTEFTITKVNGKSEDTQVVEPGDQTGMIDYAEKSGHYFVGWFEDEELTIPADFSDIQSDMTVYAKYISKRSIVPVINGTPERIKASLNLSDEELAEVGLRYELRGKNGTVSFGEPRVRTMGSTTVYQYSTHFSLKALSGQKTFWVTPYWTTLDGTVVYGDSTPYTCMHGRVI